MHAGSVVPGPRLLGPGAAVPDPRRWERGILHGVSWSFLGIAVATAGYGLFDPADFPGFQGIAMVVGPAAIGVSLLLSLRSGGLASSAGAGERSVPTGVPPPLLFPTLGPPGGPGTTAGTLDASAAPGRPPKVRPGHAVARLLAGFGGAWLMLIALTWTGIEVYLNSSSR